MAARRRGRVEQLGLFDPPTAEDPPAPKAATRSAPKPAAYTDYRVKGRVPCADCSQLVYEEMQEKGTSGREIRQARIKRTEGANILFLCHAHAQARKTAEEMAK